LSSLLASLPFTNYDWRAMSLPKQVEWKSFRVEAHLMRFAGGDWEINVRYWQGHDNYTIQMPLASGVAGQRLSPEKRDRLSDTLYEFCEAAITQVVEPF